MIEKLKNIVGMAGWRGALVVYVLGALSALAMPPTHMWWLLFVTVPLFLLRFGAVTTFAAAFREGWLFGFGYFCVALHWIGFAFLVDAKTYLWMMPFAVGGLAAVMAIYWGLATAAAHALKRYGFVAWLSFPMMLAIAEWLRGHLMTGFPWAVPGLAADGMGAVVQVASVIGMTGLTLTVLLWACSLVPLITDCSWRHRAIALLLLMTLPACWVWGWQRVNAKPVAFVDGVTLRLVQPDLSQDDKWRSDNSARIFEDLVAQSVAPSTAHGAVTHIIWPESAVPFLLDESEGAKAVLRRSLQAGQVLMTGAIRRAKRDVSADHFTSVLVFNDQVNVIGTYDKWRLVPGGEFLPFAWLLEPLGFQRLVTLPGGFAAGDGAKTVDIPGAGRAAMMICYEAIFPQGSIDFRTRPSWIINVTNDGWFGVSTGPYQHLAQARLRAIEQGLPLARAANTGISAVFDAYGEVQDMLPLGVRGVVDTRLPVAAELTVYGRFGDYLLLILLLGMCSLHLISRENCHIT